jgi:hypothetical protein
MRLKRGPFCSAHFSHRHVQAFRRSRVGEPRDEQVPLAFSASSPRGGAGQRPVSRIMAIKAIGLRVRGGKKVPGMDDTGDNSRDG